MGLITAWCSSSHHLGFHPVGAQDFRATASTAGGRQRAQPRACPAGPLALTCTRFVLASIPGKPKSRTPSEIFNEASTPHPMGCLAGLPAGLPFQQQSNKLLFEILARGIRYIAEVAGAGSAYPKAQAVFERKRMHEPIKKS